MKPHIAGRVHAQGLDSARFDTAADVVRHLGCVQSQLHDMALWAVGRRTTGLTLTDLQQSFERGDFLRTHVLRPTWHFIDPGDIHWMLALTAPRISRLMATTNKGIGLTDDHLERGATCIVAALAAGGPLMRSELGDHLADAGLPHRGQALAHIVMHAEISALIVNGPMRGKQHTYTLLPAPTDPLTHDERLAAAAVRYGRGHGPIRAKDLAWWTSLTLTDSRRAIDLAGLPTSEIDGETYATVEPVVEADVPPVMLLSNFDEYISYVRDPRDFDAYVGTAEDILWGSGLLMIEGRLAGLWTRSITASTVTIRVETSRHLTRPLLAALDREAQLFGTFVGREPIVHVAD